MDFSVCDLGHNGKTIQCVESIKERMLHGTRLRGDEETGEAVRCVPMDTMVTIRKAVSSGLEGMAGKRRPLLASLSLKGKEEMSGRNS